VADHPVPDVLWTPEFARERRGLDYGDPPGYDLWRWPAEHLEQLRADVAESSGALVPRRDSQSHEFRDSGIDLAGPKPLFGEKPRT